MSFIKSNVSSEAQELLTIFVETLTGTTFEVKVSPQDKVKSIKCKIQKVEGIPVSHQHLLYQSRELEDSSCVSEPSVALHDRATVKLVLSMRGGPISLVHQAVPLNRTVLKNLVRFNREELLDDLPAGCKMAILVLRVGDQLNLLHVVEDTDDSLDPLPSIKDNLSIDLLEGESSKIMEENSITMEKVCDLRERMDQLSLQRKSLKTGCKKKDPSTKIGDNNEGQPTKPEASLKLPSISHIRGEMFKSRSEFSQVPILPDIIRQPLKNTSRDLEFLSLDEEATSAMCSSMRPKTCPGSLAESQVYDVFSDDGCQNSLQISQPHFRSCVSACSSKLHHEWGGSASLNILPPISTLPEVLNNHRPVTNNDPVNSQSSAACSVDELRLHHNFLDEESEIMNCESRNLESNVPLIEKLNLHHKKLDEHRKVLNSELRKSQTTVPLIGKSRSYRALNEHRKMLNSELSSLETRSSPTRKLSLHHKNINTSVTLKNLPKEPQPSSSVGESIFPTKPVNYLEKQNFDHASHLNTTSSHFTPSSSYELFPKGSTFLVPSSDLAYRELLSSKTKSSFVEPVLDKKRDFQKKNRLRCSECRKRLPITGTFECRCGFAFCSYHRYSESHHCTYDFKKESRKMLEQANPTIVAPKLPKI